MKALVCTIMAGSLLFALVAQAQDIEAKLLGNTSGEGFTVKHGSTNDLFTVRGNGRIGAGTMSPEFRLSLIGDGGIIATGTFGSGASLTTSGAGTRFIWYPQKAAIRAGVIDGNQWNDGWIGQGSVAMGENTLANHHYATAFGYGSAASGMYSTALGYKTIANALHTTALGCESVASEQYATALGRETIASEAHATAMGYGSTASGGVSTAMGLNATASGGRSIAGGDAAVASGLVSVALGNDVTASGSSSCALGNGTKAEAQVAMAIGQYNVGGGSPNMWAGNDPLFEIGIGTSNSARENAMTVKKNGDVTFTKHFYLDGWFYYRWGPGYYSLQVDVANNNAYWSSSDRRLKHNINGIDGALERVAALRGVEFEWNNRGLQHLTRRIEHTWKSVSGTPEDDQELWSQKRSKEYGRLARPSIGFVAQEVREIFPGWVRAQDGYLEIDTRELNALLVEAIKELRSEKDREIAVLRAEMTSMRKEFTQQLRSLEQRLHTAEKTDNGKSSLHGRMVKQETNQY
ncbi:MAG: hypothetical protein C0600_10965 [Ignavibacteria bacterium]|nr:MAG: hypothetical protein C0600_10965 [Ignavibacteria bacterium]